MKKIILSAMLVSLNSYSVYALSTIDTGSKISSSQINANIGELNNSLASKGFSLRFTPVISGEKVNIQALNSNFNRINPLRLYDSPLSSMQTSSNVVSAEMLNNKFSQLNYAVSQLFCENKHDSYSDLYNRGTRIIYTFSSDYINPSSELSVYVGRGWPNVSNYGYIRVYNSSGAVLWNQNYDLGTSSSQSATATYVVPFSYYRKGNYVEVSHSSNNSGSNHSYNRRNVNLIYNCP